MELAVSPETANRLELAAEPDLPDWVTDILLNDGEAMVRMVMAARPGLPSAALRHLLVDADPGVRAELAANRSSSPDADARLAGDLDPDVVIRLAIKATTPLDVLTTLCVHDDQRVRAAVAANPGSGEAIERSLAYRETDPVVLGALAAKTTCSLEVLTWLAQHPLSMVAISARHHLTARRRLER